MIVFEVEEEMWINFEFCVLDQGSLTSHRASTSVEATPVLKKPANPCVHAQNKRNQHLAYARCPLLY